MNVLLSIKPKYVDKIVQSIKKYEFRKIIFKNKSPWRVYIYCSSPVKKIVGYFTIETIIEDHPYNLWETCKDHSGISKEDFFTYFEDREKGYAIKIDKIDIFKNPVEPNEYFDNFIPPQSYKYLEVDLLSS
ncbi:hypothetical protein IPM65_02455 [Candidatus Roizmanbacteria bacterium]|nr:MAG: hypothetical protein IPM65_02455 [Candidatus Roizmanbacteria bacterium]